jgi:hypothetical protein
LVSLLPSYDYLISNIFQSDGVFLTGNGSIGFTVSTNTPGYNILSVSGNSDTSNGGPPNFTFTNTLSGVADSPLVSQGTPFGPKNFDTNTTTSNVQVAWTQGAANNAGISTSLRLRTNPPEPPTVPAPLPLLGVGGAFGFSRRLRLRLKQAGWRRS